MGCATFRCAGLLLAHFDDRPSAMDHQGAQSLVATFADPAQFFFPTTGMLLGHHPEPSCHFPTVAKLFGIAHGSDDGGCRNGADAINLHQEENTATFIGMLLYFCIVTFDSSLQRRQLATH